MKTRSLKALPIYSSKCLLCYKLFSIISESRKLRWAGHVARMEQGRSAFKILTVIPAGNIRLGRPRRRWESNIRMDLKEIGINTRK